MVAPETLLAWDRKLIAQQCVCARWCETECDVVEPQSLEREMDTSDRATEDTNCKRQVRPADRQPVKLVDFRPAWIRPLAGFASLKLCDIDNVSRCSESGGGFPNVIGVS